MSEKTLKFGDIVNFVGIDQTVVPDKCIHNGKCSKYFIGYLDANIISPLHIILPQMSGYIKYFDDGGKIVF